ncbi:ABC transporter substrate-binding protein [Acinetobacter rudis]|uniref:Fe/B12 periplasmic-binding domain-containing protein n=1 Tax=Acinetobacter rudis CIP 110305 TaxID=421052 RepID=S3N3X9_9GAMM|nr:ABC transporter substrate-binding protein [Acinetobacter rudis]EPF74512.1 hypothetical protein F945_01551 [Acinetobacter rudis CIP 110305]
MKKSVCLFYLLSLFFSLCFTVQAAVQPLRFQDIAKQQIQINRPVQKVILANGNLAYAVAVINPTQQPFRLIQAWGDGFKVADYTGYQAYQQRFPTLANIYTFKDNDVSNVNLEKIIALHPDVVIFNLSSKSTVDQSNFPKALAKLNIAIVYVDFSLDNARNTAPSIEILGKVFDQQHKAQLFNQFRQKHLDLIEKNLSSLPTPHQRPQVFIERAAGLYEQCCLSYGRHNLGQLVTQLGAENIAERWIKGYGIVHPEQLMTSHPDLIIMTGADWKFYSPQGQWINLGPGVNIARSRQNMQALLQRPAYKYLTAVKQKRVHALWHPFYDSPYQFIAMQQIAKWLYPEAFRNVNPELHFQQLHQQFLPIPYQAGYWFNLDKNS